MGLLKRLLFTILFLLICSPAWSATYYIDYDSGADTNNGTATGTAFQHCPGDANATDAAAATVLTGGDTVLFKGGVIYVPSTVGIVLSWSGTSGNIITYDGNSAGTYGTGKAIIQGTGYDGATGANGETGFYTSASRNYITIQNFEIRGMGGGTVYTESSCTIIYGYGIHFAEGGTNITIKDCKIWDMGDWENKQYANAGCMEGTAVHFDGIFSYITIDGLETTQAGRAAIWLVPQGTSPVVNNIEIKNCNIYTSVRWAIQIGAASNSATIQDISIHDNLIHDQIEYNSATWLGTTGTYPHGDGIMLTSNGCATPTFGTPEHPNRVYNNSFYVNSATATKGNGTADIFITGWGGTLYIYNNLFLNTLGTWGSIALNAMNSNHAADYHIYNNSQYSATYFVFMRNGSALFSDGTVDISNNIIYAQNNSSLPIAVSLSGMDNLSNISNNILYTLRSDGLIALSTESGSVAYKTVATLNALDNADNNIGTDPLFTDISAGLGATSSSNDLTLGVGSPAINIGRDLSAYFTTDYADAARPTGTGTWDAGAYESGASEPDPEVPDYTITILKAGTAALTLTTDPAPGAHIYASGAAFTITKTPGANSTFISWSGCGCSGTGDCTGNATEDCTVTATADADPSYTLTVTYPTNGEIITSDDYLIICGGEDYICVANYYSGTPAMTTTCPTGWYGATYSGDCSGATCTPTMSADKTIGTACIPKGARVSGGSMGGGSIQ